jgi:hypothetical protein
MERWTFGEDSTASDPDDRAEYHPNVISDYDVPESSLDFCYYERSPPTRNSQRVKYGTGIDARRTAQFHGYNPEHSEVYQALERVGIAVTKDLLLQLTAAIVDNAPPGSGLIAPGRTIKRIKSGLVFWLEENARYTWAYLGRHGIPE